MPPSLTSKKGGKYSSSSGRHYQTRACIHSQFKASSTAHLHAALPTRELSAAIGGWWQPNASPIYHTHTPNPAQISRNSGRSGARTRYLRRADAGGNRPAAIWDGARRAARGGEWEQKPRGSGDDGRQRRAAWRGEGTGRRATKGLERLGGRSLLCCGVEAVY